MNIQIKISAKQSSTLTETRRNIVACLTAILAASGALDKAAGRQAALTSEIRKLESGDPGNRETIRALSDARTELSLIEKRLSELPPPSSSQMDAIISAMRTADEACVSITEPSYTAYASEIAVKLRPFCISDAHALHLARQTQSAIELTSLLARRFGPYGFTVSAVRAQLAHIDQILSGEFPFAFDSKQ